MPLPRHRQLFGGVFLLALDHAVQPLRVAQVLRGPCDAVEALFGGSDDGAKAVATFKAKEELTQYSCASREEMP
jgi:hypothetical protein